jgi:hypothetical protein
MTTETPSAPSFNIADLVFALQVFETCAQRGAFRADEMSNVGAVYDRLRVFLIANGALNTAAPATTEEAESESTDSTTGDE